MSFVGRAAVWEHLTGSGDAIGENRSVRLPGPAPRLRPSGHDGAADRSQGVSGRLTPLNMMTGSRIAASGSGAVTWVDGHDWDDVPNAEGIAPRLAEHLRRPYQQIFEALRNRANRVPEARTCPRCGQAPHNDWGQVYERLICREITQA